MNICDKLNGFNRIESTLVVNFEKLTNSLEVPPGMKVEKVKLS